jgi:hypothetical protein
LGHPVLLRGNLPYVAQHKPIARELPGGKRRKSEQLALLSPVVGESVEHFLKSQIERLTACQDRRYRPPMFKGRHFDQEIIILTATS